MTGEFPFDAAPFDRLSPTEQAHWRGQVAALDFPAGSVLLASGAEPAHCHLLISGHVQQAVAGEPTAVHRAGAWCGVRALLAGQACEALTAIDAVTAWCVPKAALQRLIASNAVFSAWLFADLARGLGAAREGHVEREFVSLMSARIRDAYVRKPYFVDGALDLVTVCGLMSQQGVTNALVRDAGRIGMFTTTDLRDALLREAPPQRLAVRDVAQFELIAMHPDAELFDALLSMIRHRVHRVLVRDGDTIVGVLSQLDLMGFVSNHSHLIALQIQQAEGLADLRHAAQQVDGLIELLHSSGVRIEFISGLVSELNAQLFARLWSLVASPELVAHSCLIVMGSEGRGEQILKTDQDNALLLRDGFEAVGLEAVTQRFNAALIDFGYPKCPGDIMLTNPLWRQPLAGFKQTLREWIFGADAQGPLHLAVFLDARAVAGDASLLIQAREYLQRALVDNDVFFARFASAVDQFAEPGGWWNRLPGLRHREEPVFDLKKLGTFPVVHGTRALALQHHIAVVGTRERLSALAEAHKLDVGLARDLREALHFLMKLKLTSNLRQRQLGLPTDNGVRMSALSTLERDQLKETLTIVRRFRQHLHQHYRLDSL